MSTGLKKYMLTFLSADYGTLALSPEQLQTRMGQWGAWTQKMHADGSYVAGHALHPQVRHVAGPERVVTDRPGTEVKELIGGYYIVNARDLEHATEIAQDYPNYDLGGTVEVREVLAFSRPED